MSEVLRLRALVERAASFTVKGVGLLALMGALLPADTDSTDAKVFSRPGSPEFGGEELTVMTANVRGWQNPEGGSNVDLLLAGIEVAQPDVTCVQEADLDEPQVLDAIFEAGLNVVTAPTMVYPLEWDGKDGAFGNMVLSRYPLELVAETRLPNDLIEDFIRPRNVVLVKIGGEEQDISFFCHHLDTGRDSVPQLDKVGELIDYEKTHDPVSPVVSSGDFNMTGKEIGSRPFAGLFPLMRQGASVATFPAFSPRVDIDNTLLHLPDLECTAGIERTAWAVDIGSDHMARVDRLNLSECSVNLTIPEDTRVGIK
jgi:endonuclease/exonuclease/phosphatase family metal-dependent hydrolase